MSTELKENFERGSFLTWLQVHNVAGLAMAGLFCVALGYLFYVTQIRPIKYQVDLNRANNTRIDRTINGMIDHTASIEATIQPLVPTVTPTPKIRRTTF